MPKVFGCARGWPCQYLDNINHIDNICLDITPSTLDFGNHFGHLIIPLQHQYFVRPSWLQQQNLQRHPNTVR
ncbi:hypothetical protein S83_039308 [Arachis hypogaea]